MFQTGTTTSITNSVFTGNVSTGAGGAISGTAAVPLEDLTIKGSSFTANQAVGQVIAGGGALYCPDRSLSVSGSSFTSNEALAGDNSWFGQQGGQAEGGAIEVYGANVAIDSSIFQSNIAHGGAGTGGGGAATGSAILLGLWLATTGEISNSSLEFSRRSAEPAGSATSIPSPRPEVRSQISTDLAA